MVATNSKKEKERQIFDQVYADRQFDEVKPLPIRVTPKATFDSRF
jgi:hypothetical protein